MAKHGEFKHHRAMHFNGTRNFGWGADWSGLYDPYMTFQIHKQESPMQIDQNKPASDNPTSTWCCTLRLKEIKTLSDFKETITVTNQSLLGGFINDGHIFFVMSWNLVFDNRTYAPWTLDGTSSNGHILVDWDRLHGSQSNFRTIDHSVSILD